MIEIPVAAPFSAIHPYGAPKGRNTPALNTSMVLLSAKEIRDEPVFRL
jgi:hypothetical protein